VAEAGQVVLGPTTHEAIRHLAIARPLDPIEVKGKRDPIACFVLDGLKDDPGTWSSKRPRPTAAKPTEVSDPAPPAVAKATEGSGPAPAEDSTPSPSLDEDPAAAPDEDPAAAPAEDSVPSPAEGSS
jgi:hypothetical protein